MNNSGNVLQMQRAAAARVREMEERSRRLIQEHPVRIYRGVTLESPTVREEAVPAECPPVFSVAEEEPPCIVPVPKEEASHCTEKKASLPFVDDEEGLLVLLLAVILLKSGAPMELVLALLYVAL